MSSTKHTPGPWYITTGIYGERILSNNPERWNGSNARVITRLAEAHGMPPEEQEANFKLAAAAPELEDAAAQADRLLDWVLQILGEDDVETTLEEVGGDLRDAIDGTQTRIRLALARAARGDT